MLFSCFELKICSLDKIKQLRESETNMNGAQNKR